MVSVFSVADSNVQLGFASRSGLCGKRRRSGSGAHRCYLAAERGGDPDSIPRAQADQVVAGAVARLSSRGSSPTVKEGSEIFRVSAVCSGGALLNSRATAPLRL